MFEYLPEWQPVDAYVSVGPASGGTVVRFSVHGFCAGCLIIHFKGSRCNTQRFSSSSSASVYGGSSKLHETTRLHPAQYTVKVPGVKRADSRPR